MPTYEEQIESLNDDQRNAAEIAFNAVVAAGAGSGKTKVLASRFLHLVVQKEIPVENILALTFTRKAAAEMSARIYSTLANTESDKAQKAAAAFYSAQIQTLDSFCASICRAACRGYGISPDFAVDNEGIEERAGQAALSFILQHRESPALISLMRKFSLEDIAERLFAAAMMEHSSLSAPLDFEKIAESQKKAVREKFAVAVSSIELLIKALKELSLGKEGKTWDKLNEALKADLAAPDIADRKAVARFVKNCAGVAGVNPRIASEITELRAQAHTLACLANYILNEQVIDETFFLLGKFQRAFNEAKRAEGVLSFRDISQMALDALKRDEALRRFWKDSVKSIMIDEFQDNNELQKDLLYLLSGESEAGNVPKPESLEENKLFFVGDEKQSIYRFRGADVSVFRRLKKELGEGKDMPQLRANYRTEKRLLVAFNSIFPHVFLPSDAKKGFEDYEAEFSDSCWQVETEGVKAGLEVILFAKERFDSEDKEQASEVDSEAAEVAKKIRLLVEKGDMVRDKEADGKTRPCTYSDIAILFRRATNQRRFEQALRDEGIPFTSESLTGLFDDAPANDIYALLRLACNPEDTFSYAVVLRSPFAAVDDASCASIMAARAESAENRSASRAPFSAADAELVAECSREKFAKAAEIYAFVQEKADKLSIARIVSALWYDFGYRYAVISDPALARYREIYDCFFELARLADAKALSLSDFLDGIDKKWRGNERFGKNRKRNKRDEIDVPAGKGDAVRLMTVHKSKGLEFPIVFIVEAGSKGQADSNAEPFYFSEKHSITINTEAPEELKGIVIGSKSNGKTCDDNFFYMEAKAENDAKAAAETKRLLYVAMTRAEAKVFVSGRVMLELEKGEELPADPLSEEELLKKVKGPKEEATRFSFLDLLLPAIANAGEIEGVSIREALPKPVQKKKREAETAAARLIEGVECVEYKATERARYAASELYTARRELEAAVRAESAKPQPAPLAEEPDDEIDALLEKHRISHADFGTYVHAAIEEGFTGSPASIPQEAREAAFSMAERFFASEIGKAAKAAAWRQTEYGFKIRTEVEGLGLCVVSGKMDLVFEDGGTLFVVDYKTDKEENPAIYMDQMETYKKAAQGLFANKFPNAKVEGALFYLRRGRVVKA